ncbi:hypothetical protein FRB96_007526 [Tulasnella sp. 330]|nr:hypothetical protein FRB96_007526 [Tulasnella sp. 330]
MAEVEDKIQEQNSIISPSRAEGDLAGRSTPVARGNHQIDSLLDTDTAESDMDINGRVIGTRPSEGDAEEEPACATIVVPANPIDTRDSTQSSARASQTASSLPSSSQSQAFWQARIPKLRLIYSPFLGARRDTRPKNVTTHIDSTGDWLLERVSVEGDNVLKVDPAQDEQDDREVFRVLLVYGRPVSVQPEENAAERKPQANAGKEHRSSERGGLTTEKDDEVYVATNHDEEELSPACIHAVSVAKSPVPTKIRVLTKEKKNL